MDKIYEISLFMLAAVSSADSPIPFLGPDAPNSRDQWKAVNITDNVGEKFHTRNGLSVIKVRKTCPALFPSFISGPLEERAWAWQERYCSVRTINFTEEEVRWICSSAESCECVGEMEDRQSKDIDRRNTTTFSDWHRIVTEYSQRQLTYGTDRLPALAGVASQFHTSLQSTYRAGLWEPDLPRNLAWYRREFSDCPTDIPSMIPSLDNEPLRGRGR